MYEELDVAEWLFKVLSDNSDNQTFFFFFATLIGINHCDKRRQKKFVYSELSVMTSNTLLLH